MKLKGEMTVFLSLTIMLILGLTLGLMEASSIQGAKNFRRADETRALECVFAEYQKELLETFHIFAVETSYETGNYDSGNMLKRMEAYAGGDTSRSIRRIRYMTDGNGRDFYIQVVTYMKNKYGISLISDYLGETSFWERDDENAARTEDIERETTRELQETLKENETELPGDNNPMKHVEGLKSTPLIDLVTPKGMMISQKEINVREMPSKRELNKGYGDFSDEEKPTSVGSDLLFAEYILDSFTEATDSPGESALDYQVEYYLEGKSSDRQNLEGIVEKLILMRFASNYVFLQGSPARRAEAEALAAALCTAAAVPVATDLVAQGLILAWAFGESVMDMRTLLKGNRVPLMKTEENWQLQISGLMKLGTGEDNNDGADVSEGMTYKDYLRALCYLKRDRNKTMRAVDLVEMEMVRGKGLSFFRADQCVTKAEIHSQVHLRRGIQYDFKTYFGYR